MYVRRYDIDLDPFIAEREQDEDIRILKARKPTKRKKIYRRYVSVNRMYPINRFSGRKYLSDEGRAYKEYIENVLDDIDDVLGPAKLPLGGYAVTYVFFMTHEMLFTKEDEFRDVDVSNMFKAAEDAVFSFLGEKDSTVVSIAGYKREADIPRLVVLISPSVVSDDIIHCGLRVTTEQLLTDATVFQSDLQR